MRPILLELLPRRLSEALFWRVYRPRRKAFPGLYVCAPLRYAPQCAMHDLLPGDVISDSLAFLGYYEEKLSRALRKLATDKGGLLVDVGANMGYFSLIWAAAKATNTVHSFEASPRNIRLLRGNVSHNGLDAQIRVDTRAASDASGKVRFSIGQEDQTGWGGISNNPEDSTIEVEAVRLDDVLADVAQIAVLKVDVEGADTLVLEGCKKLLSRKAIREIFFEQNPSRMSALGIEAQRAQRLLSDLGYRCEPFDIKGHEWVAYPA